VTSDGGHGRQLSTGNLKSHLEEEILTYRGGVGTRAIRAACR